jgi:hypothetical protein
MTVFLANSFSPSMLKLEKNVPIKVKFTEIDSDEFCKTIKDARNLMNSIGHKSTVELINMLCGTSLEMNRTSIIANEGDVILGLILTIRLEEGRILKNDEIMKFLNEGKIKFVRVEIE